MQRNIPNHFATLKIQPTRDLQIIIKAYKDQLRIHHPDRHGGNEAKAKDIIAAYEMVSNPKALEDCYQEYAANPGPKKEIDPPIPSRSLKAPSPPEGSIAASAMVTAGVKVTIFIPLKIRAHSNPPVDGEYFDEEGFASIYRFIDPSKVDYNWIANKLTEELEKFPAQVGVDPDEIGKILRQHSYYKYCRGAYAVGVEIPLSALDARQSEKALAPDKLSAGSGEFFWIRSGVVINPLDIFVLTKAFVPDSRGLDLFLTATPNMLKPTPTILSTPSETPLIKAPSDSILGQFLNNKDYWKKITVGLASFPIGIKKMQECIKEQGLDLQKLQIIANERLKNSKQTLFDGKEKQKKGSRNNKTTEFYEIVVRAKNIEEIEAWINMTLKPAAAITLKR